MNWQGKVLKSEQSKKAVKGTDKVGPFVWPPFCRLQAVFQPTESGSLKVKQIDNLISLKEKRVLVPVFRHIATITNKSSDGSFFSLMTENHYLVTDNCMVMFHFACNCSLYFFYTVTY